MKKAIAMLTFFTFVAGVLPSWGADEPSTMLCPEGWYCSTVEDVKSLLSVCFISGAKFNLDANNRKQDANFIAIQGLRCAEEALQKLNVLQNMKKPQPQKEN